MEIRRNEIKVLQRHQPVYRQNETKLNKQDSIIDDTFHFSIKPVATFVQFLGLMPVCGTSSDDPKALKFQWKSFRAFYTIIYSLYGIIISTFFFTFIYDSGISAKNIGNVYNHMVVKLVIYFHSCSVGFVFFSYTTVCAIVFLTIATNWPELMMVWAEKEKRFLKSPYKPVGWRLSFRIRFTAACVILLAFIEHVLFLTNAGYSRYRTVLRCNWTVDNPLSYFLEENFSFLFGRVTFNLPLGLFVEVMNVMTIA